jgi:hypothetical protein
VSSSFNRFLICALILIFALLFFQSVTRQFNIDEFEHVHAAWYVQTGHVPYRDFFQNHNPLLYYLMAPVLSVSGDSPGSLILLRLIFFLLTVAIAFVTHQIAKLATKSDGAAILSVVLLLTMAVFFQKVIEIRPDVPQVLFALISVYYLLAFLKNNEPKSIAASGLYASISFIFLQKTAFLLISYAILFVFLLLKNRLTTKNAVRFSIWFSGPLILFAAYLLFSGSFKDYLMTCWLVYMTMPTAFSPLNYVYLSQNALFWILSLIAPIYLLRTKNAGIEVKAVAFLALFQLVSLFAYKFPYRQEFMLALAFSSIAIAYFVSSGLNRFKVRDVWKVAVVVLLILQPLPQLASWKSNGDDLARINYVLESSRADDRIYDGMIRFNLYRPDLHYFWLNMLSLKSYNELTKNKYGDYDVCRLIKEKRPKFISDYMIDLTKCGLDKAYLQTKYEGLYMRKE